MPRKSNEERATQIVNTWQSYHDSPIREEWLRRGIKSEEYLFGYQISSERREAMEENRLYPAIKNRVISPARQLKSELSTKAPSGKVIVTSAGNVDVGNVFNSILKHIEYKSKRPIQVARTSHEVIGKGGLGWMMPIVDKLSSDGEGDILMRQVPNENVYVAPTVRNIPTLTDAPCVIIAKPVPLEYAIRNNPKLREKLENEGRSFDPQKREGDGRTSDNQSLKTGVQREESDPHSEFDSVFEIEKYSLQRRKRWRITNKMTGNSFETYEKKITIPAAIAEFFRFVTREELPDVQRVKVEHLFAPNIWVSEEWLELDRYPMVPFVAEDTGNLFPFDLIWFVRGEQDLLNKFESMRIQYIQLSMHGKIILDRGASAEDKKAVIENFAKIGVPLEIEFTPDGKPMFTIIQPTVIPNAFLIDAERAEAGISEGIGVYALQMGDPKGAPRTHSGTMAINEFGKTKRRGMFDLFNSSLEQLYDNIIAMIPSVYNTNRVITYLDDDHVPRNVEINKEEYVDGALQKVTVFKRGDDGEIRTVADISKINAEYRIVPDSFLPTDRAGMIAIFSELYQVAQSPTFLKEIVRHMDLPNRAEIIQEIDLLPKLQAQNQQLQGVIRDLKIGLDRAQREEVNARQAVSVKEHETKRAIQTIKHAAQLKIALNDAENKIQDQVERHELNMDEIELNAKFAGKLLSAGKRN